MNQHFLIGLSAIIVFGILAQWISWRLRFPSILLLLIFGIIAGPVTNFLDPDLFFGDLLFPFVSISVSIILFEGGLNLKFSELKAVGGIIRNLITIGIIVTLILSVLGAYYILGFSFYISFLLGSILVVTGPTVILPILRHVKPKGQLNSILKWEGIINDPIGALMAILVFESIIAGEFQDATVVAVIGILKTILISSSFGLIGGFFIMLLIKKQLIPDFLQNPAALTFVIAVFTASNLVQAESGLFAVTVMGIFLANQKSVSITHIIEFKENLRLLLLSVLFIILAARLKITDLQMLNVYSFLFVGILLIFVRPLSVFLSTIGSHLNIKEKIFLSWMAPRGIVAAAVSSLFSIELIRAGHPEAEVLVPIMFLVIIVTITVYGLSSSPLAKWLGLSNPNPQGCLIIGAHPLARAIGNVIKSKGFKVLLVDTNYYNIKEARMEGLAAYQGSITSQNILDNIDLEGIGKLLALTPNKEVNSLSALYFIKIFGSNKVYQLTIEEDDRKQGKQVSKELRGQILFGNNISYNLLQNKIIEGWIVKSTPITEEFNYDDFLVTYNKEKSIPLFLINENKNLVVFTSEYKPVPKAGQTIISLVKEN